MEEQLFKPAPNKISFFRGFLQYPSVVASIVPSSRFLEQRLVKIGNVAKAKLVVELGPGTGGTTMAFLEAMPMDSNLLAIELNPGFTQSLEGLKDNRLIVHLGNANKLSEIIDQYDFSGPDLVVSGIPFSTLPQEVGISIVQDVWKSLAPGGRFVAYQFRDRVAVIAREVMGPPKIDIELLNVPPVRIFSWQKDS